MTLVRSCSFSLSIVFVFVFTGGNVLAFDDPPGPIEYLTVQGDFSSGSGVYLTTHSGGVVTFSDLHFLKNDIGEGGEVPEPTSLILAALAIVLAVPGRPARKF